MFYFEEIPISFFFHTYRNLTALSVQSRSLKVTAILNETSFGIFKSKLTKITKKYGRDQIVEGNVYEPAYCLNLFSKQLSR